MTTHAHAHSTRIRKWDDADDLTSVTSSESPSSKFGSSSSSSDGGKIDATHGHTAKGIGISSDARQPPRSGNHHHTSSANRHRGHAPDSSDEKPEISRHVRDNKQHVSKFDTKNVGSHSVKQAYFSPTHAGRTHYDFKGKRPIDIINDHDRGHSSVSTSSTERERREWNSFGQPTEVVVYVAASPCMDHEIFHSDPPVTASPRVERREDEWERVASPRHVQIVVRSEPALERELFQEQQLPSSYAPKSEHRVVVSPRSKDDDDEESEEDLDESVPEVFKEVARQLNIPDKCLVPVFKKEGLLIERAYSVLRYRRDEIEEFKCQIKCSREHPILGLKVVDRTKKPYRTLMIPDVKVPPTTEPTMLDCFIGYKWPRGDAQLLDLKHAPIVLSFMRNMREPLLLICQDEAEQQRVHDCLHIIQAMAARKDEQWKAMGQACPGAQYPNNLPLPKVMLAPKKARRHVPDVDAYNRARNEFLERLTIISKKMKTEHAVKQYLTAAANNDLEGWVCVWAEPKNKYVRRKLNVWIHHFAPFVMTTDKKGRQIIGKLDLNSISCGRAGFEENMGYPAEIRHKHRSPHMCHLDLLDYHLRKVFFSFETVEKMKDFQQVCATLAYLQAFEVNGSGRR